MALSATAIASITSALSNLNLGQITSLGTQLTQANELKAIQVLDEMAANPATAGAFLPQLAAIPNVPATVTNWVDEAIANPSQFAAYIAQAKNALLSTTVSTFNL